MSQSEGNLVEYNFFVVTSDRKMSILSNSGFFAPAIFSQLNTEEGPTCVLPLCATRYPSEFKY